MNPLKLTLILTLFLLVNILAWLGGFYMAVIIIDAALIIGASHFVCSYLNWLHEEESLREADAKTISTGECRDGKNPLCYQRNSGPEITAEI